MIRTSMVVFLAAASLALAADWPQWRGPERTGVSRETGLLKEWPADGPALRWKAEKIGTGYSSPAIVGGKVYLQTTTAGEEYALVLDEKTGKQVWRTAIGKVGPNKGPQYPGTRATPTVVKSAAVERIYCLASDGEVTCLDGAGKSIWHRNLVKDFGGVVGNWAYSESLLVDGDLVICTPGGTKAGLAALNRNTGETVWQSELPGGDIADYASIMPLEAAGTKQYVQFLRGGLVGVDAKTGKFLWRYKASIDFGANILTPVIDGSKVFTSGSRTGGGLIDIVPGPMGPTPKEIFFEKSLAPSIGGAVLVDGHLYGSAGTTVFCAEFATGKTKWREPSVGAASVCVADGMLYARGYNSGDIALIELNPAKYTEKGRFKQADRSKTAGWQHPVVANGGLYIVDQNVLLCYEVSAKK